ncbi:glycerophosphoryl diester phosphodiesterase [Nocardioides aurantiacus]|uniref:Glycerophosphoryl diester phosphodiesterase n=1 Tax=Nocardioides aurantiacus TaxID=86796 RepID=A0A3N2CR93_9ACTN|nr:glycerophosphoryl diester phosphodiesterase [Nocardioides aurantiacus]
MLATGRTFDLQAHRGGAGLWPENSLLAFDRALALGVTTLECDVHVSADGVPVLSHERTYAGHLIARRTWTELAGLSSCGPEPLATLDQLLTLVHERGAEVGLNVETKFDVLHAEETAPRERFVEAVVGLLTDAGALARTSVQSFDWAVLRLVRAAAPQLRLNALSTTDRLEVDQPGASPWLAGLDIDDYDDSVALAAASLGFDALSPSRSSLTPDLVDQAHAAGLRVLPYTVDDAPTMRLLVDLGVDGLITNRPDVLRRVLAEAGQELPVSWPG